MNILKVMRIKRDRAAENKYFAERIDLLLGLWLDEKHKQIIIIECMKERRVKSFEKNSIFFTEGKVWSVSQDVHMIIIKVALLALASLFCLEVLQFRIQKTSIFYKVCYKMSESFES